MKDIKLRPNDVTYNSMIDVCVRCEQMEKAWNLLTEMQEENIVPDNFTYSTLIKGLKCDSRSFSQRNLDKAFMLLEQMKK